LSREDDPAGHPNYAAMDVVIAKFKRNRDHKACPRVLKEVMAAAGVEITVSTCRPLVIGPYTQPPYTCPHGTRFWIEPTGEQIAQWAQDETP